MAAEPERAYVPLTLTLRVDFDPLGGIVTLFQDLHEVTAEVPHRAWTTFPEAFAPHDRWALVNRIKQALTDLEVMNEHRWSCGARCRHSPS